MEKKLILSAGMPRAGSGWYFNLVHDLVVASGGQDSRTIRKRYHLEGLLTEVNCNISTLRIHRLIPVMIPSFFGNEYTIKTHASPTRFFRALQRRGRILSTYIFRDPRAALLSAYEYGQRGLKNGRPNAFSHLMTIEHAADFIDTYLRIWAEWSKIDGVLLVRYEDLVIDFDSEIKRLSILLERDFNHQDARTIIDSYRPEEGSRNRMGTHFHKGEVERYRQEFSPSQLERFTKRFQPILESMGYAL